LREVEAPTFSDIRLTNGGEVSLTRRPPLTAGIFLVLISVTGLVDPRAVVRLEGIGPLKKCTSSGTLTRDFRACIIVPQPTTLPRAPIAVNLSKCLLRHSFVSLATVSSFSPA
jgi:hypothetical protein